MQCTNAQRHKRTRPRHHKAHLYHSAEHGGLAPRRGSVGEAPTGRRHRDARGVGGRGHESLLPPATRPIAHARTPPQGQCRRDTKASLAHKCALRRARRDAQWPGGVAKLSYCARSPAGLRARPPGWALPAGRRPPPRWSGPSVQRHTKRRPTAPAPRSCEGHAAPAGVEYSTVASVSRRIKVSNHPKPGFFMVLTDVGRDCATGTRRVPKAKNGSSRVLHR
jgi:hypothetical protein